MNLSFKKITRFPEASRQAGQLWSYLRRGTAAGPAAAARRTAAAPGWWSCPPGPPSPPLAGPFARGAG